MIQTYSGLVHLNGNLLCSVDFETTGRAAGYHEPIQIAVVPLDSNLCPIDGLSPFYTTIMPLHPERAEKQAGYVHGIPLSELLVDSPTPDKVQDMLIEWYERLELPFGKTIVPLAHNWAFESKFLQAWLGVDLADRLFHSHARDAMLYAVSLNDRAAFLGLSPPFNSVGLESLCRKFKIINQQSHDALCDALAEAEVYKALLQYELV